MVAPLIAKAATRGASKATRQSMSSDRAKRMRRSAFVPQSNDADGAQSSNGINLQLLRESRSLNHAVGGNTKDARRIRVMVATTAISWGVLPFYVPQFLFWVLGLVGISLEASPIPLLDMVVPGTEIFIFSYFAIALIGISSLIYAAWVYTLRGIKVFDGIRMLAFAGALTGYLAIFLNLFPWVIFWMLVMMYTEKAKGDDA